MVSTMNKIGIEMSDWSAMSVIKCWEVKREKSFMGASTFKIYCNWISVRLGIRSPIDETVFQVIKNSQLDHFKSKGKANPLSFKQLMFLEHLVANPRK